MATPPLDELIKRLSDLREHSALKDLDKNVKALLTSTLSRMNLVTREEFEVQQALLQRLRDKLGELEARLAVIEQRDATRSPDRT